MDAYNALYQGAWMHAPDVQQAQDAAQTAVQGDSMSTLPSTVDINRPSFGLAEIQQASSPTPTTIAPAALYNNFASLAQNGHANFYAPYNVVAYGQTPWPQQQIPLSSYSTLNGATTNPSQPQQRQAPSTIQPMMLDPSLTINVSASGGSQPYSQNGIDQHPQQSAFQSIFPHSPPLQQQTLGINPIFVNALAHHQLQQQQHHQQTTLSPTVLHSPTPANTSVFYPTSTSSAPMQTNLTATTSNSSGSSSSSSSTETFTLAQRRSRLQTKLKTPFNLSGAGAVKAIVYTIDDCGMTDVDPSMRLEIITRIRDKSPAHFLRAWCENADAMDITREWLKDGATGKDNGAYEETIMPLLQVIARLPFTIDQLSKYKLGKIIVKLTKEPPNPAIKDMAADIEKGWKQLIAEAQDGSSKKSDGNIEDKTKKRKLGESSSKVAPPAKKVATSSAPTTSKSGVTVKKEKSKAKNKLPSFKKAPPMPASAAGSGASVKRETSVDGDVAQPSAIDPFQEALKAMQKGRKGSPVTNADSQSTVTATVKTEVTKSGKKGKSVTWAPQHKLEQIKLIERAIYDDDPMDGSHSSHSIRDLERAEGAAMHQHLFEEAVDWYEPIALEFPSDLQQQPPRGSNSQERIAQEEREKGSLEVLYVNANQVPESPAEPLSQIPVELAEAEAKTMYAGSEMQPLLANPMSVTQLVGQLKGTDGGAVQGGTEQGFAMNTGTFSGPDVQMVMQSLMVPDSANNNSGVQPSDGNANAQFDLRQLGLDPSALSSLTSLLSGGALPTANGSTPNPFGAFFPAGSASGYPGGGGGFGEDYGTGSNGSGFGNQQQRDEASGRGRRGRGRGADRGRRKQPCSFHQQGRCKFGDTCDFSHDRDSGGAF